MKYKKQSGYALVELLMVMLIIGLLASIAIPAFNGEREKSKMAKAQQELGLLGKAVMFARNNTADYQSFTDITNTGYTASGCANETADPKDLPKTNLCWTRYVISLQRLSASSGIDLSSLEKGDPWGNPYFIDENENESGFAEKCRFDNIGIFKDKNSSGTNVGRAIFRIPMALAGCNNNTGSGLQ